MSTSREDLEKQALEAVCACDYYDLADTLQETPDEDLKRIINREACSICD